MNSVMVSKADQDFLRRAMRYFKIPRLKINWSDSTEKFPDLWCDPDRPVPTIWVTQEWARQEQDERRKRLTHECLHIIGMEHDKGIGYNTEPDKDTYSMRFYLRHLANPIWVPLPDNEKKRLTATKQKIPPAWKSVKIDTEPKARLEAVGFDSKGRKVYLYSQKHKHKASTSKFDRLKSFIKAYPRLVKKIEHDSGKIEEAAVLNLISKTGFRVGSEMNTQAAKKAYGASTLQSQHVNIDGETVIFDFIGKKGVRIQQSISDSRLASELSKRCKRLDGNLFDTDDGRVRRYLRKISGAKKYDVKDFRTYIATSMALDMVNRMGMPKTKAELKRMKKEVATAVARKLGNTPAVALSSYISPEVFRKWEEAVQ